MPVASSKRRRQFRDVYPIVSNSEIAYKESKEATTMYLPREEGQGLVEYALILVLVAVVVIAILALLGPQIANIFSRITNGLTST